MVNNEVGVVSPQTRVLIEQMRKLGGLPALNENIQDIFRLSGSEQTSAADLAAVIMRDCGLASTLLVAANSTAFAPRLPLKTITAAITFLGFDQVHLMALAFSVFKQNLRPNYDHELLKLYARSYFSGVLSMTLARETGYTSPEEIFVAGMFYNLPSLALAYTFPDQFKLMLKLQASGQTIHDACQQVFEVPYEQICLGVMELYRIPGKVEELLSSRPERDLAELKLVEEASYVTGMLFGNNPGGKKELSKAETRIRKLIHNSRFSVTNLIRNSCCQDKNINRFFNLSDEDIKMMVNVLEWGKANPAQVVTKLGIGTGLDDTVPEKENPELTFNSYLQELFLLRRSNSELNQMLMLAQEAIFKSFGAPDVFTAFIDQSGEQLEGRFFIGAKSSVHAHDLTLPLSRESSPLIRCFQEKRPCRWTNGDADLELPEQLGRALKVKYAMCTPLVVNRRAIGLYFLGRTDGPAFTSRDELWLAQIVENVELLCEKMRSQGADVD